MNLEEQIFQTVVSLVNKAKIAITKQNFDDALTHYKKAESAFPDPIANYDGSHFLYISIAEVYIVLENLQEAKINYQKALQCIDGKNDAQLLFNIGIIALKQEEIEEAKENLVKAYNLKGKSIFLKETKYLDFFEKEIFNKKQAVEVKAEPKSPTNTTIYRTHNGKNFTEQEWKIYEEELWIAYQKNNKK
jgi:tetratricopeptide (TPR) repeat protein